MGGQRSTSKQRPFFFEGQEEAGALAIQEFFRRFQQGSPTAIQSLSAKRASDRIIAESAQSGLSASDPLTQKRLAFQTASDRETEESQIQDLFRIIATPVGQIGSSKSGGGGLSGG